MNPCSFLTWTFIIIQLFECYSNLAQIDIGKLVYEVACQSSARVRSVIGLG